MLREKMMSAVKIVSELPRQMTYNFDSDEIDSEITNKNSADCSVQQTKNRTVRSLNFGEFQAREIIREERIGNKNVTHRSKTLNVIVPKGARYAYDLIAYVGCQTYLENRKLSDVHAELSSKTSCRRIPFSSLYDIQRKFLFYLGKSHYQASPRLKEYFRGRGKITWLIDGTLEPGTSVFFGVKEAEEGIFLESGKIPTENADDIVPVLGRTADKYGTPDEILHDLSPIIANACETAFPETFHRVCNYRLLKDVGGDLYKKSHAALTKRLREIKLQSSFKEQRRSQSEWLRQAIKTPNISLVLADLLRTKSEEMSVEWNNALWREVLLAIHFWILDYPSDGHRQGYPFDPYLLYFHRRIDKAHAAMERLFYPKEVRVNAPKSFTNFYSKTGDYLTDPVIMKEFSLYENACDIFERLRSAFRLCAKGPSPMHESYDLTANEPKLVKNSLEEVRNEFVSERIDCTDCKVEKFYDIALSHLDKYWEYLLPADKLKEKKGSWPRTTNGIETHWHESKSILRQIHGRKKLTRDFQSLPTEFMLVPNLKNSRYIELVFGSLDQLASKFSEVGKTAGPYSHWLEQCQPLRIGRPPTSIMRKENFLDDLLDLCDVH